LGPRHLRDDLGVDEADRLDPRDAGGGDQLDELGALGRVEVLALVLEPVAGRDVEDDHAAQSTPSSLSEASSSSESPSRPPYTSELWLPSSHVADQRTAPGVSENFGMIPGPMYSTNSSSWCGSSMSRALNCGSSKMS